MQIQSPEQINALVTRSARRSRIRTIVLSVFGTLAVVLAALTTVLTVKTGKQAQQVSEQNVALKKTTTEDQTALQTQKKVQKILSDGAHYTRAGDYGEATKSYDEVLGMDPKNVVALNYRGYLDFKNNDYSSAVTLLQKAVDIDPTYTWGHYNLALALAANGDMDGATRQIETLVKQSPKFKATIQGDPQFKTLRRQPAVQALLAP
jgi:predicted Zn-dependent protease